MWYSQCGLDEFLVAYWPFDEDSGNKVTQLETVMMALSILIVGIGMGLRASELVGLKVSDVYDGGRVKSLEIGD